MRLNQGYLKCILTASDACSLCLSVAGPSTPSDGAGRPDEDTFGVSFPLNDVDETAAANSALGLDAELLSVSAQICFKTAYYSSKGPCRSLLCVLTCSRCAAHRTHVLVIFQNCMSTVMLTMVTMSHSLWCCLNCYIRRGQFLKSTLEPDSTVVRQMRRERRLM